jgi:hypothetical protein
MTSENTLIYCMQYKNENLWKNHCLLTIFWFCCCLLVSYLHVVILYLCYKCSDLYDWCSNQDSGTLTRSHNPEYPYSYHTLNSIKCCTVSSCNQICHRNHLVVFEVVLVVVVVLVVLLYLLQWWWHNFLNPMHPLIQQNDLCSCKDH